MLSSNLAVGRGAGHDSKQVIRHKFLAMLIVVAGALFVVVR